MHFFQVSYLIYIHILSDTVADISPATTLPCGKDYIYILHVRIIVALSLPILKPKERKSGLLLLTYCYLEIFSCYKDITFLYFSKTIQLLFPRVRSSETYLQVEYN